MIIARFRTLQENGTYAQILLLINTIVPIVILGMPNSITFFLGRAKDKEERITYLSTYYVGMGVVCVAVGLLLFVLAPFFSNYYKNPMIEELRFVFLILPITLQIIGTASDVLISLNKTFILISFRLTYSISVLLANVCMVWTKIKFTVYMEIYVVILCFYSIILLLYLKKTIGIKILAASFRLLRQILKFSIPIGIATIIGILSLEFDKIFISSRYSTETMGIYNYMAKELPITVVTQSLISTLLPAMARLMGLGKTKEGVEVWKKSATLSYIIICFFTAGTFAFAPQVISILYGGKYLVGSPIFRIYTFAILMRFTYFAIFFNSMGKTKKCMVYSSMGLVLNICLNYVFYYFIGFYGPAYATVVSLFITNYLQLRDSARLTSHKMTSMLEWRELWKISITNIVFAIGFYFIQQNINAEKVIGENVEAVLLAVLWGTIYFFFYRNKVKALWKQLKISY